MRLVENGRFRPGDIVIETVAAEYLAPLNAAGVDTLVLGCTHYPLLEEGIAACRGPGVAWVSAGAEGARAAADFLRARGALSLSLIHISAVTLGGFTLSLELLLLAACLYSGGDWFPMAAAATLFLSLIHI